MSLSPNLTKVAEKSKDAHAAIKKMQKDMEGDLAAGEKTFQTRIDTSLKKAMVADGRMLEEDQAMKVEFRSEFSLDKIADVINKSLLAVIEATDPLTPAPAISPDALRAYTGVVSAVAEAAKSSSTVSSSLSYSMTHLSPGIFAFLYATASSIHDEKLFGTEEVTSTAIFYRIVESIDDVRNAAAFDEAVSHYNLIKTWTALRVDFAQQFGRRDITRKQWAEMDSTANFQIAEAKKALAAAGRPEREPMLMTGAPMEKAGADVSAIDTVLANLQSDTASTIEMLEQQGEDGAAALEVLRTFAAEGA